jgi:uncharacterized protein (TIGR04255 family)
MTASTNIQRPPYKNPPIIEAVISVHFDVPVEERSIDAFARKRKAAYPRVEDNVEMSASLDLSTHRAVATTRKVGRKLTSGDGSHVINFLLNQMAVIQLAPYADWDTLYREARKNWDVLVKIHEKRAVSRVSARYINRIDIPARLTDRIDLSMYFNVGLSFPKQIMEMDLEGFNINFGATDQNNHYRTVVNFTSSPQIIIDHLSFTIDIDVITIDQLPPNDDRIWDRINSLRAVKNDLFESFITNETRELFG